MAVSEPSPTPDTPRPDPYAAWRIANFRLYAVSWFAMTMARQIEFLAVGIYLYGPNKDVLALGWQGLAMALPAMLLAIAGGQLADRFDRRWVLASMLCLTAADAAALGVACYYHLSAPWIYLLLVVNAVGQTLGAPSRIGAVAVDRAAGAVRQRGDLEQHRVPDFHDGRSGGGRIVALDFRQPRRAGRAGLRGPVPLARAGGHVARAHRIGRTASSRRFRWKPSWRASVSYGAKSRSWPRSRSTCSPCCWAGPRSCCRHLPTRSWAFPTSKIGAVVGYLRSAEAAGAIFMAILLAHLPPIRRAGRTMLWAVAGFGVATVCLGLSQYLWIALAAMFLIGALDNISVVVRHTLIQLLTPDNMRGRVTAVNNVFIVASNELGGMESGVTAGLFGLVPSIVGGGVGAILVVLGCAAIWPQILSHRLAGRPATGRRGERCPHAPP